MYNSTLLKIGGNRGSFIGQRGNNKIKKKKKPRKKKPNNKRIMIKKTFSSFF
jgi:hypothetical protein